MELATKYFKGIVLSVFISIVAIYRKNIYIILKTLPRDLNFLARIIITAVVCLKYMIMEETVISLFGKLVAKNPDKIIIRYQDTTWTAKELDLYSNKIARIFQKHGYRKGDIVALMSYNKPEFIGVWLGLGKIGVVTALINTNLKAQSLAHSLTASKCKGFIFTSNFAKDVKEIQSMLPSNVEYIVWGEQTVFENPVTDLDTLLILTETNPVISKEDIKLNDKVLYIYTSGTTGLPKAAIMVHSRLVMISVGLKYLMKFRSSDVIYNPLPLYHTAGGLIGTLPTLVFGTTLVLKTKFSASNYISDCIKYKCTIGQYIGEICRYLLTVPPSKNDTSHSLRIVIGNGMRPDIWRLFVDRFKIPTVFELYGSTEGNANIVNFDNTIGAVGFLPRLLPTSLYPIALIKYNECTDEPIRKENGLCIRCKHGESGMFIGLISNKDPFRNFHGYVDQKETTKKIINNVFKHGDSAFLTGDILNIDELGYLYFKDRTGDTYRWKGENVSTGEVEAVVQKLIKYKDCSVYGVKVENYEGRAGMIAIVDPKNEIDLDVLAHGLNKDLPTYARPLFLRILPELELTGTYKVKKMDLRNEGFDINKVKDKMYFKDPIKDFVRLTESLYNDIINGVIKI